MNQIQPIPGIHHADGSEFHAGIPPLTWIDGEDYEWDDVAKRYVREDPPGIWHFVYFYEDGTYLAITVPYDGNPPQIGTWT